VVEHETVSLRLPAALLRAVDRYAKYLGGKTDRTHVVAQDRQVALAQDAGFRKTLAAGRPGRRPAPTALTSGPVRAMAQLA
jgi:hypothetical protein